MRSLFDGFTLVEILVVLVVFSILVIFSFLRVLTQAEKTRDAVRKGGIDRIVNAIEEYSFDTECYPISLPQCGYPFILEDKTYISNLPCDPKTNNSFVYVSEISACPSWFQLYGNLEYKEDGIIDKLGCRQGCGPNCQFNYGASSPNQKLNPFCDTEESSSFTGVSTPAPPIENLQYVCAPGGGCLAFAIPELSGCPDIYLNDPTCQNQCSIPKNRCHDSRGRMN